MRIRVLTGLAIWLSWAALALMAGDSGVQADRVLVLHRFKDWTDGCIAVTNAEMDEIWKAVPNGTPIEIRP
jgi:hypothetical protein